MTAPRLSVNVDHVATLRQARGAPYPTPLEAARRAEAAGAHGITVHLRGDRRHIQDADVVALRREIRGKLNLEMAVTDEMLAIAERIAPHQVSLVPERPEEVTTEGGLDLVRAGDEVRRAAERLTGAGIAVSVFLDPDPRQLERLAALAAAGVVGFEINTDRYTRAALDPARGGETDPRPVVLSTAAVDELAQVADAAVLGRRQGFAVYAGHGLTTGNVGPVALLPEIEEFNIGHYLVSRSVIVGLETAVAEMLAAIAAGYSERSE